MSPTSDERDTATARRIAKVFEEAPIGIAVTTGPNHRYESVNQSYRVLVPGRVVLGKTLMENFPELEGQGIEEIFDEVYRSGKTYSTRLMNVRLWSTAHQRLEDRFFDLVYQPLLDAAGQAEGIVVIAFDVHELTEAKRQAEDANKAKDEFIAMLGHELRNPLAPIVTALHLLTSRQGEDLSPELGIIQRQVHHMVRLVDDLLDVARITRGTLEMKKTVVELGAVVGDAVEMAGSLMQDRGHALTQRVSLEGIQVLADSDRLCQVVSNILVNAAKYTPRGGRIVIRAAVDATHVVLSIEDNGIGMGAEDLERVFGLFTQGKQAFDRPQGGLGLGLTIARSLAALHSGELTAQSSGAGQGSVFSLRLPLATEDEKNESRQLADAAPFLSGAGKRVLVVDDNVDAAESLGMLLSSWGFVVVLAYDGPGALLALQTESVEAALLDIGLPGMDGFDLARAIRALPGHASIKLVALSGYGQQSDRIKSAIAGFDEHLVKPVDIAALELVLAAPGRQRTRTEH